MAGDVWMYGYNYGKHISQMGLSFQAFASSHIFLKLQRHTTYWQT